MEHLEHDYDNLRAALRSSIDEGELSYGLRLGVALWLFWYIRGLYAEGSAWLAELLAATREQSPWAERAAALIWAAHLSYNQGHHRRAQTMLAESADVSERVGYERGLSQCALLRGNIVRDLGDGKEARRCYEQAIELLGRTGDWAWQVVAFTSFGHALCEDGDYAYADSMARQGLALARAHAHVYGIGRALYVLGRVAEARGDPDAAYDLLEQGLDAQRQLGYTQGMVWTLHCLATVLLRERVGGLRS